MTLILRGLTAILMLLFVGFSFGQDKEVYALLESSTQTSIEQKLAELNSSDDFIQLGYKGALYCKYASHLPHPRAKLDYFKKGAEMLNENISNHTSSVELRFLRYIIQSESPKMLGYHQEKEQDLDFIKQHIEEIPKDLQEKITSYLKLKN